MKLGEMIEDVNHSVNIHKHVSKETATSIATNCVRNILNGSRCNDYICNFFGDIPQKFFKKSTLKITVEESVFGFFVSSLQLFFADVYGNAENRKEFFNEQLKTLDYNAIASRMWPELDFTYLASFNFNK